MRIIVKSTVVSRSNTIDPIFLSSRDYRRSKWIVSTRRGTISFVGFENSPCKRRDNSDVHRRDTGPSTACCRPAVSHSKKKTTVSAAETIFALKAQRPRGFNAASDRSSTTHFPSPRNFATLRPASTTFPDRQMSFPDVIGDFP